MKKTMIAVMFCMILALLGAKADDKMQGDMQHHDMTTKEKALETKGKVYGEVWECSMKDYRGEKTKDGKCPKCGMKLEKKMVLRGLKKAEIGKEYVCIVSGEKFKATKETKAADYKGKTYYFCCEDCQNQFAADPEKCIKEEKKTQDKEQHEHKGPEHKH